MDDRLDGEEDFGEAFGEYSVLVPKVIEAVIATMVKLQAKLPSEPPTLVELQHRLLQMAAEQLGRERAFICGHLDRPERLRLSSVMLSLAGIIGARKVLLGSGQSEADRGSCSLGDNPVLAAPGGLLPALRLTPDGPLEAQDLLALDAAEARLVQAKKNTEVLAVSECWYLLTKMIDKVHQHIMVGIVEMFSQLPDARPQHLPEDQHDPSNSC